MTIQPIRKNMAACVAALALALLQGCATGPNANADDPLEPFNRTIFSFNDGVDRAVLKPVATVYRDVLPQPVRNGVGNFFDNLSDVVSLFNNILQGKPVESADTLFRLTTNTFFGIGGLFDVASDLGIEQHQEDFGQTLGEWGFQPGPYLVLPLFGPSSVRDTVGTVVDSPADLVLRTKNVRVRNSLITLNAVNARANLLLAGDVLEQAALDKYTFTREFYLQRRRGMIGDQTGKEERFDLPEAAQPAVARPRPATPPTAK